MNLAKMKIILCLLLLGCVSAVTYDMQPTGFRTSEPHFCTTDDKNNLAYFKIDVTAEDIQGLTNPKIHIGWKKEPQGRITAFLRKDTKPTAPKGTDSDYKIGSTNTCTGYSCWDFSEGTPVTEGAYWLGFFGDDCLLCKSQDFFYVTKWFSDGDVAVPFPATKDTFGLWTHTYRLDSEELQSPCAKMVLTENITSVYVSLKSFQDLTKANVNIIFKRGSLPEDGKRPTKVTDNITSFPKPGGSEVYGQFSTGEYKLKPGIWYICAAGGSQYTDTDFQLTYGIDRKTSINSASTISVMTGLVVTALFWVQMW